MDKKIIQYVGFRTALPVASFRVAWTPIALSFKARGIETIDLYQFPRGMQVAFLSRNVWDPGRYLGVFPSGLADAAGFGPVEVVQFGGYEGEADEEGAEPVETLSVVFTRRSPGGSGASRVFGRVTDSVPYGFASEGPATASSRPADLGEVRLVGTHACRL